MRANEVAGDASGRFRMMREFGILLLVPFLGWSTADGSQLFRCEIRDAVSLGADGRLELNRVVEYLAKLENPIIVDTSTGAVRTGQFGSVQKWDVVQAASSANDSLQCSLLSSPLQPLISSG